MLVRFLLISLISSSPLFVLQAKPLSVKVQAESAILMNAETGAVLFEKDAYSKRYPASITKVATALYALHSVGNKLDQKVVAQQDAIASISEEALKKSKYTLPSYWLVPDSTHIGIKKGEELPLRDLMYGMMLVSGNDAANVIAQHVGGTIPNFVSQMNDYLKEIGCENTKFFNPHGLFHPDHKTTAFDMALMMREALKNEHFCKMIKTVTHTRPKTNKQESSTMLQTNKLLRKGKHFYAKAIGGKTGFLSVAGNNLVAAAKDNERTLIVVLLNCKERDTLFSEAKKLFEAAFNQKQMQRTVLKAGTQKITFQPTGISKPIPTYLKEDVLVNYYPAEEIPLKCMLFWTTKEAPIKKDQQIGELRLMTNAGKVVQNVPLYAQEEGKSTWWWSLTH